MNIENFAKQYLDGFKKMPTSSVLRENVAWASSMADLVDSHPAEYEESVLLAIAEYDVPKCLDAIAMDGHKFFDAVRLHLNNLTSQEVEL